MTPLADPDAYPNSFVVGIAEPYYNPALSEPRVIAIHPGEVGAGGRLQLGNILICAGPGGGKGLLIEANLRSWRNSAVAVDLKGDTYRNTANYRRTLGQVYVLDPVHGTGHRFNPLQILPPEQWRSFAREIVAVSTTDPFWQSTAVNFWLACFHAARHAGKPHIPYALAIMALSIDGAFRYLRAAHSDDPETMRYVAAFYGSMPSAEFGRRLEASGPDRLLASKWGSVTESAQTLYDPNLMAIFSGHDVDVEGLFYKGSIGTIYVQASETNPAVFEMFVRTVISSIGNALIREGDKQGVKRRPVLMLLDELGAAPISDFKRWKATMRSRDIVLAAFVQDLTQVPNEGRDYDYRSENSMHHSILYKPVNIAGEVSQIIQQQAGMYTTEHVSESGGTSVGHDGKTSSNQGWSKHKKDHQRLRQEDIEQWSDRHAYVVSAQRKTEKFVVRGASMDLLGWERPEPAEPLPKLPPAPNPLLVDIVRQLFPDHPLTEAEQEAAAIEAAADMADTAQRQQHAAAWAAALLPEPPLEEEDDDPTL